MQKLSIKIKRGATVAQPFRVESGVLGYAAITTISRTAPVAIEATAHGIPDNWRAAVMNAVGLTEMNTENGAEGKPPKDSEMHIVTVVDANNITMNAVNAAGFRRAHTAGTGHLAYYTPVDLSVYTGAIMEVKNKVDGTRLALFATPGTLSAPLVDIVDGALEIDDANDAVWLRMTDEESELLDFKRGVFDIKLLRSSGEFDFICTSDSTIEVEYEVTTTE